MDMKVLYCSALHEPFSEGEILDNSSIDTLKIKTAEGVSVFYRAFVFQDTLENRALIAAYQAAYEAWKSEEPNPYQVLNKLRRP